MAATRASGTNAVRYGTMKEQWCCRSASSLRTARSCDTGARAKKSSAGYDLTRLFVGSEGTLGVIVEVTLRLSGIPEAISAGTCSFPDVRSACSATIETIQTGLPIARIELLDTLSVRAFNTYAKLTLPEAPMLLVEFHGTESSVAEQAKRFGEIVADNGGGNFIWTTKPEERTKLWQARHDGYWATMTLRPGARPFATDACVPISRLADCVEETLADIAASGLVAPIVGHVGDGNFHCEPARRHGQRRRNRRGGGLRLPPRPPRHRHGRHLHRRARHRPEEDRLYGGRAWAPGARPHAPHQGGLRSAEPVQSGQGARGVTARTTLAGRSSGSIRRLFIANRGEIAIRIARAASELGIVAVAACAPDDARALHVERADEAVALSGEGVRAYLDVGGLIAAAIAAGCDAVHPGYGFLSENAAFARASAEAGLVFVGPSPETLECFGDKARARTLAKSLGVPLIEGTDRATSLEEAAAFLAALGPGAAVMLKAVSGGGGRGMRVVDDPAKLQDAYARCRSEALTAFGSGGLYVERLIRRARHVEVQVIGDGRSVAALGDRECTLQRRNQKLIEIAPAPLLDEAVRARIVEAALELAREAKLMSLCTFEFLIDRDAPWQEASAFIEANPRLQVEHTVTEEVTGLDLVQAQIRIAEGARLEALGIEPGPAVRSRGMAMQMRINAETVARRPRASVGRVRVALGNAFGSGRPRRRRRATGNHRQSEL